MVASGYLVLQLTDSTFQTQLVGVAFFSSMLLGGILSGVVADAFDRKRVLIAAHLIDLAVLGITVFLVFTGLAEGWHIVMLSAVYGVPHTLDMAARRTFALDIVGRSGISYANALEGMSMMAAGMLGPFLAGALIDLIPLGKSAEAATPYLFIMIIYATALLALLRVRSPKTQNKIPIRLTAILTPIGEGARAVASNRAVIGTLGVIVIMNLLYYSYIPLVPVFADKVLGVGPTLLGVLASSQGFGAFLTAIFITTRPRINRNSTYFVVGTAVAFSGLLVFSLSSFYPLSVAGLILAGLGMSGFVSMVFTLVLLSVGEEMRGRAMGFANTAIGISPLSMLALGWLAEAIGPGQAVSISALIGLVLSVLWSYRSREMRRL